MLLLTKCNLILTMKLKMNEYPASCLLESEDPLPRFWVGGSEPTATNCHAHCHLTIIPIF